MPGDKTGAGRPLDRAGPPWYDKRQIHIKGRDVMKRSLKKGRAGRIALAVLAVLLLAAAGALVFAGNYLFDFALDPNSPGGMIGGNQNWAEEAVYPDCFFLLSFCF